MSVGGKIVKRLFDILFSLLGIVFLIPMTIFIKLAYTCTGDFHSIFYIQKRIGFKGRTFPLIKFRSMVKNADKQTLEDLLKNPKLKAEWDANQKIEHDPRITKVGRFIRHGSLDEAPQFVNVLIGHLSVIGPRPLIPGECKKHGGDPKKYESVKPGITGWWAVNGRSTIDYKKRLELEYYYIDHQSIALDAKIFFKTIGAVITKDGAK